MDVYPRELSAEERLLRLDVHLVKIDPLRGGQRTSEMDPPDPALTEPALA